MMGAIRATISQFCVLVLSTASAAQQRAADFAGVPAAQGRAICPASLWPAVREIEERLAALVLKEGS